MDDLKFNIYAMANPSTDAEFLLLLEEANRTATELNEAMMELSKTIMDYQKKFK